MEDIELRIMSGGQYGRNFPQVGFSYRKHKVPNGREMTSKIIDDLINYSLSYLDHKLSPDGMMMTGRDYGLEEAKRRGQILPIIIVVESQHVEYKIAPVIHHESEGTTTDMRTGEVVKKDKSNKVEPNLTLLL